MEMTEGECQLILALIKFVWSQGGIRSVEHARDVEALREKLVKSLNGVCAPAKKEA